MLHIAEQFLQVGRMCILESNFKLQEIEKVKILLEKYDCDCLTFVFKGDFDVLYDRYAQRDESGERHWVHQTAGENRDSFQTGHLKYGLGEISVGKTINVDATSFADINYKDLFNSAKKFYDCCCE